MLNSFVIFLLSTGNKGKKHNTSSTNHRKVLVKRIKRKYKKEIPRLNDNMSHLQHRM